MHGHLHMSELVEIVDSLENKISKLLHKIELFQQTNLNLEKELLVVKNEKNDTINSLTA